MFLTNNNIYSIVLNMKDKSLAKEINERLDQILDIRSEIKRMNADLTDDVKLNNMQTGKATTKQEALDIVEEMVDRIKEELNEITNNGKNVKDIFTNKYYINDTMQDKELIRKQNRNQPTNPNAEYISWNNKSN